MTGIEQRVPSADHAPWNGAGEPAPRDTDKAAGAAAGGETAAGDPLARVLELEGEVRRLRALLEVRNEAFRALMARLVAVELRAQVSECDRLRRERDEAVALATVLQELKIYRYTKWPRAAYGVALKLARRLR